jgi:hypothetical protein
MASVDTPVVAEPAAVLIRRGLTTVVFVIAGLSFAFGFGNGWLLGLELGVPSWIAPLVAPAVDLSVVALLATLHYLRARGATGRLVGPRLLLICCGLTTFALNTMRSVLAGATGRACFDAIAPMLLIGWSEVGPRLLALLHGTVPGDSECEEYGGQDETASSKDRPGPSPDLIEQARQLDREYRQRAGRPITRDRLRASLHVSNAVTGELLKYLRDSANTSRSATDDAREST